MLADRPLRFSGPGLRDTTRLASGPAGLWTEILARNREAVTSSLRDFRQELERVEALIVAGDDEALREFLERAGRLRGELPRKWPKSPGEAE